MRKDSHSKGNDSGQNSDRNQNSFKRTPRKTKNSQNSENGNSFTQGRKSKGTWKSKSNSSQESNFDSKQNRDSKNRFKPKSSSQQSTDASQKQDSKFRSKPKYGSNQSSEKSYDQNRQRNFKRKDKSEFSGSEGEGQNNYTSQKQDSKFRPKSKYGSNQSSEKSYDQNRQRNFKRKDKSEFSGSEGEGQNNYTSQKQDSKFRPKSKYGSNQSSEKSYDQNRQRNFKRNDKSEFSNSEGEGQNTYKKYNNSKGKTNNFGKPRFKKSEIDNQAESQLDFKPNKSRPFKPKKYVNDTQTGGFNENGVWQSGEKEQKQFKPKYNSDNKGNGKTRFYKDKNSNFKKNTGGKFKRNDFKPQTEEDDLMRLNRYIANAGICSRREADELIEKGKISVNNEVITELGYKIKKGDVVLFNGKPLRKQNLVYVLLNKPKDFITTMDDPENRKTVMDLVKDACKERVFPVGRLDRDTTGILLLTNDGELAQKLSHPSNQVSKIYQVELDKAIKDEHYQKLLDGVLLEDGWAMMDDAVVINPERTRLGVEIHLGRNRIIRRIFERLGYEVVKLDRTMYAGLTKQDLKRGQWRMLNEQEIIKLKHFSN
jgi:23S rRNA pseudouridine2605 synthase